MDANVVSEVNDQTIYYVLVSEVNDPKSHFYYQSVKSMINKLAQRYVVSEVNDLRTGYRRCWSVVVSEVNGPLLYLRPRAYALSNFNQLTSILSYRGRRGLTIGDH